MRCVAPLAVGRSQRLTPLPALGPLYLVGLVICVILFVEAMRDGRYTDPMLVALVLLGGACYLGVQQGVYLVGDRVVLRFPLARTAIPLRDVRAFTIRHEDGSLGDKRVLWIELNDGGEFRTHVGVSRNLFTPAVRMPFEKMVALVEHLDQHRRQAGCTGAG